jgi:WhiB family redox-sensing transcriptional regulator
MTWRDEARCRDMPLDIFFPPVGRGATWTHHGAEARAICQTCTVIDACRDFAIEHLLNDGIYGGLDPIQRRKIRRTRTEAA